MKVEAVVDMTPRLLAEAFCEMMDEAQAQFFIECAALAKEWTGPASWQWNEVGTHLRTCSCSTEEARDMVLTIADGIG